MSKHKAEVPDPTGPAGLMEASKLRTNQGQVPLVTGGDGADRRRVALADTEYDARQLVRRWNAFEADGEVEQLRKALRELASFAALANEIQHNGVTVPPSVWADLYQATNEARAALALAEGKGEV